ncbi:MAG: T9SS type A sorting domain-containing protein [Bacteroidota bacterium]
MHLFSQAPTGIQRPFVALLTVLLFSVGQINVQAQSGCPDCVISLPDSIQEDTFYLQDFSAGEFRVTYDESVTYRLPTNTSQVTYLVPSLPEGIGINELSIKSVNNLPAGLSWEASQSTYDLPDERDGCLRICGTPLEFGQFDVEITVTAKIAILNQDATFTRPLYIAPPSATNSGFSMTNNVGCGQTTVQFENNNPSNGRDGFSYTWDFGLGSTSADEQPQPQTYDQPGVYPVQYRAIIDTIGYILTKVEVLEADCSDFLGKPDLRVRITDPSDNIIFESESVENTDPPVTFTTNLDILSGNYQLEVIDGDSGLNGNDDICGTINFNQLSDGELTDGPLKVAIDVFHPVDTVNVLDSVIVNAVPNAPIVSYDGNFIFCEGDTLALNASGLSNRQQWYRDSTPISEATHPTLGITESGAYYIASISEEGCVNTSSVAFLGPIPLPEPPVLKQEGNLLSIFNTAILPDPHSLRWFQEGNLLDHTAFALCIEETGKYGIELTNSTSGCSNYFESTYTYDEDGICSTSAEEIPSDVADIRLYPNPVQNQLTIELTSATSFNNGTLYVLNMLGQRMHSRVVDNHRGTQVFQVDLTTYAKGMYLVQLQVDNTISSWKVVKQ